MSAAPITYATVEASPTGGSKYVSASRSPHPQTQSATNGQMVAEQQPCASWSSLFKCPLTIFTIIAVIGFFVNAVMIWNNTAVMTASAIAINIVALIVYVIIVVLFGYWIKKNCEKCEYTGGWLVFLLAIFFPVIATFVVSFVVALFNGSFFRWTSSSFGSNGSGSNKYTPPPQPFPQPNPVPGPVAAATSNNPIVTAAEQLGVWPSQAQSQALNNIRSGLSSMNGL